MPTNYLAELSELLEGVHKYNGYLASLCPFHQDSRPSFFVYPDRYRCASCEANGKTEYLYHKLSKQPVTVSHIKREPTKNKNPWNSWGTLRQALQVAHENLKMYQGSQYMRDRGISTEWQIKLGLGIRDNWILFPCYTIDGELISGVARAGEGNKSESKYVVPFGHNPNTLYIPRPRLVYKASYLVLTFGIIDALSLAILGIPSASTTSGKRIDPKALEGYRRPIFIFPDAGEEQQAEILASKLGWRGSRFPFNYPIGMKDPNDVFTKQPTALKEALLQL